MRPRYFRLEGKEVVPVTPDTWMRSFEERPHVGDTRIDGVRVSTVFLGLDHNFSGEGEPLLFETMIFGGALDEERWRWSTWGEAELGHAMACAMVRDSQVQPSIWRRVLNFLKAKINKQTKRVVKL